MYKRQKLPLSKYSVDGSSGEGSWALLKCLAQAGGSDKESQEGAGCDKKRMRSKMKKRVESTMPKPSRGREDNPGTSASVSPWARGWRDGAI